ncbi:heterokaryon incompatibility protein-domain-containing protein [Hypoxylon argillaceum]|nr:heterokaryon incompatibility protein-domain-containing protein [Hypoxylon argillaceum]
MRLLTLQDDGKLILTKDLTNNIPFYAILSHTWGPDDEEVTFKDIVEGAGYHKDGYKKIQFCGRQAASDGLRYFWVDSCCIDKSNNTELSQAINSMFRWYNSAAKCYVYLSDVSSGGCQSDGPFSWESTFRKSKWFTRGWTLQELIAPRLVEFFSVEGQRLGDKVSLERELHEITRIATSALRRISLSDFSRKERMLWAQGRTTKLEEDRAYCLLGIFQVYLPLIYGEGAKNAFRRLEEEIDKQATFERSRLDDDQGLKPDSLPVVPLSLKDAEESCLRSLWFPSINTRRLNLEKPADQTCLWLFEHEVYQNWFMHRNRDKDGGLLWLKGKPGTGKSVLMKEAFRRAVLGQEKSDYCTAAFFFNAKGDELENSPFGLFRSLLYQLLPRNPKHLERFRKLWDERNLGCSENGQKSDPWQEQELRFFFKSIFMYRKDLRIIIFIDALDECEYNSIRSQVRFWRQVTWSANIKEPHLNVCISMRSVPVVTLVDFQEIVVERYNSHDIAKYVTERFTLSIADEEPQWEILKDKVLRKSAGVFLWVVLVVDDVLRAWDDGESVQSLLKQLDIVPEELENLFSTMLSSINESTRAFTIRFFQWAVLATRPLRLHEWHHIMAFIRLPAPSSLHNWRKSLYFTRDDDQLEKQIRSISKGLIQVSTRGGEVENESLETLSVCAGAGSLDIEYGETRIVEVIHQSVRDFFLKGNGFSTVFPGLRLNSVGDGHLSIMSTCLDYISIKELNALVQARNIAEKAEENGSIEYQRASTFEQLKSSDCYPIDVAGWMGLSSVPGNMADQITRNKWSPCVSTASPLKANPKC